ncbi:MAG: UDP-glucose--hexose-1-phosphate uridylyltransferase [Anaerolineae bacterium]|nr:UDP-glucose--hexose-1-phosphate uridylyltransferase [Anaerolineae bacterium]
MPNFDLPHRRFNPLTQEWVLVSPHRAKRPWQGGTEKTASAQRPAYDPTCYLCPGNVRANGAVNPNYAGVYVFDNDFAAILPLGNDALDDDGRNRSDLAAELLQSQAESGVCRVICFSPCHDQTMPDLSVAQIAEVVQVWMAQCAELGARDDIRYVQLFENKGEVMGCSNPHPHGQLWASYNIPTEIEKETRGQAAWLAQKKSLLLRDYLTTEQQAAERLLFENEHFACVVPFWAVWPFETMLLPKRHIRRIVELTEAEQLGLADALKRITTCYDQLFDVSFPYSMGVHQAPYDGDDHPEWQMHLHFYPPLLRSATVKKFLVGYEMLAQPQRDLTPEQAADRLRRLL